MRYEHAGRFWTITRAGSVLTIVSGKLGNRGRTQVKHHPTEAAAIAAHDRLVLEKQRAGYRIAGREPAAAAPPPEVPADDDRGAALEAAIVADPDDAQAFAVYGDWLQKHGDPRGELIALQHAGPKAAAAAGKHLAKHAARLLGPLAALMPDLRVLDAPPLIWRHGYLRRAELASAKGRPLDATLGELLAHPSARFLVELALRAYARDEALAILEQLRRAAPPTLRELDLFARANLDRIDGEVWRGLPHLERLTIAARAYDLAAIELPALRRARFLATSLSSATVRAVASAPWPVLERLELRFCSATGAAEADFHDLKPLLERTDLPALTHLKLRGCAFAGTVARTLARAPLAHQLQVLDLSAGDFSPQDLAVLAQHAASFPNLRELWLPYDHVTPKVAQLLAPVAKRVIPDSKGPVDTLDYDLAGEPLRWGEDRYGGVRE